MTDRPRPFYPRAMLTWNNVALGVVTGAIVLLAGTVFLLSLAVGHLIDQRVSDHKSAVAQSNKEIREINRLRQQVKDLGGNPGPVKFRAAGGSSPSTTSAPVPTPAFSPRPASHPATHPTSQPTQHPTSRPTHRPTHTPSPSPTPHPIRSCLRHPVKCLPISRPRLEAVAAPADPRPAVILIACALLAALLSVSIRVWGRSGRTLRRAADR